MTDPTPEPEQSAKDKMREALDRKKQREHLSNEPRPNTGSVHASQVRGAKRTFRRKSG